MSQAITSLFDVWGRIGKRMGNSFPKQRFFIEVILFGIGNKTKANRKEFVASAIQNPIDSGSKAFGACDLSHCQFNTYPLQIARRCRQRQFFTLIQQGLEID